MDILITITVAVMFAAIAGYSAYLSIIKKRRLAYLEKYEFHSSLKKKVIKKYPTLTPEDVEMVIDALRDYFFFCVRAEKRIISMPSQVVDVAWHEFILFTRLYDKFCHRAFGRFLHHTPTEAMHSPTVAKEGIKRIWRLACIKEGIDPKKPTKLPLIFAVDTLLKIEDGFIYSLNCKDKNSPNFGDGYCASHIGCASGCSSDGTACGANGCGSDGCGGGCGGD